MDGEGDVVLHTVGVDSDGRRGTGAGGRDHLGSRVDGVARPPDTGDAGAPGAIDDREAGVIELAAELGEEVVTVWGIDRPDEHRSTGHDAAFGEFDATQMIVLNHESGDLATHHADAASAAASPGESSWVWAR